MDVIALHQAGFTNAVAALGTSFTADHARLMSRYTDEVILIFDADEAGRKGAQRAIGLLREVGIRIRLVNIPDGKDPDEYIKKNGAEHFKLLIDRSANDVEYRLVELGKRHLLNTSDGKVNYLKEVADFLAGLSDPLEREVYATRVATELGVSKDNLLMQVNNRLRSKKKQQAERQISQIVRQSETAVKKVNPEAVTAVRAASAEEALLGLLLLNPDYIVAVQPLLPTQEMVTPFNRRLYDCLLRRAGEGKAVELSYLAEEYDADEMAYISRMVKDARERVASLSLEEAKRLTDVIKREKHLQALSDPADLTPEQIQEKLKAMKELKK